MQDVFNPEIGSRIRFVRCQKELTLNELSERVGISSQFLTLVETGQRGTSLETFSNIAQVLHVTSDYLLFGISDTERLADYATQSFATLTDTERKSIVAILDKAADILRNAD